MGQILRLQRLPPFPLRMTSCLDYRYIGFNYLQVLNNLRLWIWKLVASATIQLPGLDPRRLYPFEALAEISDFVAGLVQRVPKKPNEMKADLQNSTASQGDCIPSDFLKYFSKK